jgi:hypothetical protein
MTFQKHATTKEKLLIIGILLLFIISLPATIGTLLQKQSLGQTFQTSAQTSDTTTIFVTMALDGIGIGGDVTNPKTNTFSNKDPNHTQRKVQVLFYTLGGQQVSAQSGSLLYDEQRGFYVGMIDIGTSIPTGNYIIKIKTDSYLVKRLSGTFRMNALTQNNFPPVLLVAGDVNGDNALNILDYNTIMGCYSDTMPAQFCDAARELLTDISDDGSINMKDYNFFMREISVQKGD